MTRTTTLPRLSTSTFSESLEVFSGSTAEASSLSLQNYGVESSTARYQEWGSQELQVDTQFVEGSVSYSPIEFENNFINEYDVINAYEYENPHSVIDQSMAQMEEFMDLLQDQAIFSNTGQGDVVWSTDSGEGWTSTTRHNSNGEHRQTNVNHDNGYKAEQLGDNDWTFKGPDGKPVDKNEYCKNTESSPVDCPDPKPESEPESEPESDTKPGSDPTPDPESETESGSNPDSEGIIAETEWPMGYGLQTMPSDNLIELVQNDVMQMQPSWIAQSSLF